MLIVMQWFLVRLISYSLTFKCWGSTAIILVVFLEFYIRTQNIVVDINRLTG